MLEAVLQGLGEVTRGDVFDRVLRGHDLEAARRARTSPMRGTISSPSSRAGSSTFCTDSGMRLSSLMKSTTPSRMACTSGPGEEASRSP